MQFISRFIERDDLVTMFSRRDECYDPSLREIFFMLCLDGTGR